MGDLDLAMKYDNIGRSTDTQLGVENHYLRARVNELEDALRALLDADPGLEYGPDFWRTHQHAKKVLELGVLYYAGLFGKS